MLDVVLRFQKSFAYRVINLLSLAGAWSMTYNLWSESLFFFFFKQKTAYEI